jgi:uncharacterized protein YdhG (YjbR/CyaY superfamily)
MPSSTSKIDPSQVRQQIRAYLAALPSDARRAVRQIRAAVRSAAPRAVEVFSYGIPGFRFEGRPLVWYAGWKTHVSMYPIGTAIRTALAADLKAYKTAKGTVQFPLDKTMPVPLIKKLVRARLSQVRRNERVN